MAEQRRASNTNSHMRLDNIVLGNHSALFKNRWICFYRKKLLTTDFTGSHQGPKSEKNKASFTPESRWKLIPKILKTHMRNLFICLIISSYYRHLLLYPVTIFAKCCPVHSSCLWGKRPAMPGWGCRKHNSTLTQLFQCSVKCQLLYAYPQRAELKSRPVILSLILRCLCLVFEISH